MKIEKVMLLCGLLCTVFTALVVKPHTYTQEIMDYYFTFKIQQLTYRMSRNDPI